jgi:acetyltransferase-like isoleucine patch superfamily enzyme
MQRGTGCQIGVNVSLSPDTVLGNNATIGNNVTIYPKVSIGDGCRIFDGAVIGRLPISTGTTTLPLTTEYLPVQIGPGCVIGCNSVLYTNVTLGERVLIGDLSAVREGTVLEDEVLIGQGTTIHRDLRIGKRTHISYWCHIGAIIEEDVFVATGVGAVDDNNIYLSRFGLQDVRIRLGLGIQPCNILFSGQQLVLQLTMPNNMVVEYRVGVHCENGFHRCSSVLQ